MEGFEAVQNFFCSMHCSRCNSFLKPDGITILKEESNFYVVKVTCVVCNQPVGLAIVGIERKLSDFNVEEYQLSQENKSTLPPISYNDVIDAHHFFSNLGADWTKYIDDRFKSINKDDSC